MILSLSIEDDIQAFCNEERPLFVIDQINGLVESPLNRYSTKTNHIRNWLAIATHRSKIIYSTSAKNYDFHQLQEKRGHHLILYLYGGFSTKELKQQQAQQKGLEATESKKKNTGDSTGCVPLFLEHCLVDGKGIDLNKPDLLAVSTKAVAFAEELHSKSGTGDGVGKAHWD